MKISENVLQELNSLDDLIKKMGCENPKLFKYRVEFFKYDLGVLFPDFTMEEIVKIYNNFDILKAMFSFADVDEMMTAIEFEQIKNKENDMEEKIKQLEYKWSHLLSEFWKESSDLIEKYRDVGDERASQGVVSCRILIDRLIKHVKPELFKYQFEQIKNKENEN